MENKFLVCFDSDGTAIDSMTIKHVRCFGPIAVEIFGMQEYKDELLELWNNYNLYEKTRGINRFKGLKKFLIEASKKNSNLDITEYLNWCDNTNAFSNSSVEKAYKETNDDVLKKALEWSILVNENIKKIPKEDIIAFPKVKETLENIKDKVDIAIVSSANREAIDDEWQREGLLQYVKEVLDQTFGTKEMMLEKLAKEYDKDKIIMLGDSLFDMKAAKEVGVLFYPVIVNKELESFEEFNDKVFDKFLSGDYLGDLEQSYISKFEEALK